MKSNRLSVGLDVGSTTVKIIVMDPGTNDIKYSEYRRHFAEQAKISYDLLKNAVNKNDLFEAEGDDFGF